MKIEEAEIVKEPNYFSMSGYAMIDCELNLATEFKRMINLAFDRHPRETYGEIADRLGIGERTLNRVVIKWDIDTGKRRMKK